MGPKMKSVTPTDGHSGKQDVKVVEGVEVSFKQNEYYPIVIRRDSGITVTRVEAYDGTNQLLTSPTLWRSEQPILWCKSLEQKKSSGYSLEKKADNDKLNEVIPKWRPIIVYTLKVCGQQVHLAVVHTTPMGRDLGRAGEYEQIKGFLELFTKKENWILAGDYYLDEESSVKHKTSGRSREPSDLFRTALAKLGLHPAVPISATNQSGLPERVRSRRAEESNYKDAWSLSNDKLVVNKRADFFICSKNLVSHSAALFSPGGLPILTDPNHHALTWWANVSDHAPVGGVFSSVSESEKLNEFKRWCQKSDAGQYDKVVREVQVEHDRGKLKFEEVLARLGPALKSCLSRLGEERYLALVRFCLMVCDKVQEVFAKRDNETCEIKLPDDIRQDAAKARRGSPSAAEQVLNEAIDNGEKEPWKNCSNLVEFLKDVRQSWQLLHRVVDDYEHVCEYDSYSNVSL